MLFITYKTRAWLKNMAIYSILLIFCVFALLPIAWGLSTSLKDLQSVSTYPPRWLPNPITLGNYRLVVFGSNMPRYFLNSLIVAISTILLSIIVASHAGYAAARFNFPGKNIILFSILATAMIPGISILVPLYLISCKMGLHNTYFVLILIYSAWRTPTVVWVMRGFFESVPHELDDAALIDGCSRLQAFYRIIIPLSQPGLAAVAILVFIYVWNDFLIAFTQTISDDMRLIQTGVYLYITAFGVEWGKLMAAVIIALTPVLILFFILQKRLIQGLTAGATKG